jgi:hypothetical protein
MKCKKCKKNTKRRIKRLKKKDKIYNLFDCGIEHSLDKV